MTTGSEWDSMLQEIRDMIEGYIPEIAMNTDLSNMYDDLINALNSTIDDFDSATVEDYLESD